MAPPSEQPNEISPVVKLSPDDYARAAKLADHRQVSIEQVVSEALKTHEEYSSDDEQEIREEIARMNVALDGMIQTIRENRASIRETLDAMDQRAANTMATERAA